MSEKNNNWFAQGVRRVFGVPVAGEPLVIAEAMRAGRSAVFITRDDVHLQQARDGMGFFAPDVTSLALPAWDCLPYDRVSPHPDIAQERVQTLSALSSAAIHNTPFALITTVSAVLQRVPKGAWLAGGASVVRPGDGAGPGALLAVLEQAGFRRVETVYEAGEYAVRGGIIDLYPATRTGAFRLDYFGDRLEGIRRFDPTTQRSQAGEVTEFVIHRTSEVPLDEDAVSRFRSAYRVAFGVSGDDDPLYESVSAGRAHSGMEHWLSLFHGDLGTVFDLLPADTLIILDAEAAEAAESRLQLIDDYYQARCETAPATAIDQVPYRALPPDRLYLTADDWRGVTAGPNLRAFSGFVQAGDWPDAIDLGGRLGRDFGDIRAQPDADVFDHLAQHIKELTDQGHPVVIDAYSPRSRDRMVKVLDERGIGLRFADNWRDAIDGGAAPAAVVLGLSRGFVLDGVAALITEQDILGERVVRRHKVKVQPENLIASVAELSEGDLVVHAEHGIARYAGLKAIDVGGAAHDCLMLTYLGGDKLFIPVENLEVVTRYGAESASVQLDKLGGAAWQARKAKMKARIKDMADRLMRVAAERMLSDAPRFQPPPGAYEEFCARFPFDETEDQLRAITETLEDMAGGRPTDRLVCGDVGFGKTEVALRAAFACALEGHQVAVVVPTTLLCRQHFRTFQARFQGFPVKIAQMSRLVSAKDQREVKAGLAAGQIDIVIGTHALLAKDVAFRDLGLLVIDEEQHFGVAHKEKLKSLKGAVHVLVLSATPIPRTLQMAMTGLREMSLIATPPVDRLAVRTFVLPYDPVVIREAVHRELHRGGQVFYVCPRVADLDTVAAQAAELAPEARIAVAHGRMRPAELEDVFQAFADRAYDILVSTNIIESGLDLPSVNTIIIHRADRFGLSQLYQLRGRVGRSKVRAYAYLTLPVRRKLTPTAEKRLQVMQTLDTLGAGFTLASHDLDIRGAGNLLGEEQSGQIREVGVELYQRMLEEAVAEARGTAGEHAGKADWSPQISLGTEVLIPETFVPELGVRLELYRRISRLTTSEEVEAIAEELADRFGVLPLSVENLLDVVKLKAACRAAGVARVDAGPRGATVQFHNDDFADPAGLVAWIGDQQGRAKLRPDHRMVYSGDWDTPRQKYSAVRHVLRELAAIAAGQRLPAA